MKVERRETLWPETMLRSWLSEPWMPRMLFDSAIRPDELRVEEYRDNGSLVIRCELPGIDPDEDVEITVRDQMLRIQAERKQEEDTETAAGFRSEFRYGSFGRVLPLPPGASEQDVKARYKDGILEVRVPVDIKRTEGAKVPVAHD